MSSDGGILTKLAPCAVLLQIERRFILHTLKIEPYAQAHAIARHRDALHLDPISGAVFVSHAQRDQRSSPALRTMPAKAQRSCRAQRPAMSPSRNCEPSSVTAAKQPGYSVRCVSVFAACVRLSQVLPKRMVAAAAVAKQAAVGDVVPLPERLHFAAEIVAAVKRRAHPSGPLTAVCDHGRDLAVFTNHRHAIFPRHRDEHGHAPSRAAVLKQVAEPAPVWRIHDATLCHAPDRGSPNRPRNTTPPVNSPTSVVLV